MEKAIHLQSKDYSIPTENVNDKNDLRDKVPDLIPYINGFQVIVGVRYLKINDSKVKLTSEMALQILTGVQDLSTLEKISTGPVPKIPIKASSSFLENDSIDELNAFETLFGRDSLIAATNLLQIYPELSRQVIVRLAQLQGTEVNNKKEEEPGKIMHEYREADDKVGNILKSINGWEFPYYGSVDSTPMFVRVLIEFFHLYGRCILDEEYFDIHGMKKKLNDALHAAVEWIEHKMDQNPDGLIESLRMNPNGLVIQSWKDSKNSHFHKDGSLANDKMGISSIEVQGITYDALVGLIDIYKVLPKDLKIFDSKRIDSLIERANNLRKKVINDFWVDEEDDDLGSLGYFALGTDRGEKGHLRKLEVKTSNMGQLLNSRLLDGNDKGLEEKIHSTVKNLFAKDMLNINGIRTLSSREIRFYPGGYHYGSVWLFDNAIIAEGLIKRNYKKLANILYKKMDKIIAYNNRFPEFAYGGDIDKPLIAKRIVEVYDNIQHRKYSIERPPQEIQAWSVSAIIKNHYQQKINYLNC